MDRILAAIIVVVSLLCVSSAQVQIQRCLLSRLDFVECQYNNKRLIRAGSNEFSIHHTLLREGQSGFVECLVRRRDQFVDEITDLGTKEMRIIYSSGFIREENYDNQLLMEYNVECGEDELAFFNMTDIDIEGNDNCNDTNGNPRCQDYIQIDRGSFGTTELCGNTAFQNEPRNLEGGRFKIFFRTSEVTRKPGFRMFVVCFKPEERDLPGCFEADEFSNASVCMEPGSGSGIAPLEPMGDNRRKRDAGDDVMTDELDSYGFRMRRDLVEFHKKWQRMKRDAGELTFVERNILHNETVRFTNRTLIVRDVDNTEIVRYDNVLLLETFDETGTQRPFFEKDDGIPTPGPGPLYIVGQVAFFQLFAIDPRGLIPDEQEAMELQRMNEELLDAVPLSSDPNVTDPNQRMADLDFPGLLNRRRRQDIVEGAMEVDEQAVFAAFRNREACNPVLRAQSRATLTYYRGINSSAVDALETFPIKCNVDDMLFLSCDSVNATIPGRTRCTLGDQVFPCDESFMSPMNISEYVGDQTQYTVTVTAVNCNGQTAMDTVIRQM